MNRDKNNQMDLTGHEVEQIVGEIFKILDASPSEVSKYDKEALHPKLRSLISLAAALAFQRNQEIVSACIAECCKAGACSEEILEVLHLAIVMGEIPAEQYSEIVRIAMANYYSKK